MVNPSARRVFVGAVFIFVAGVVTYYSALRIGFLNTDWYYLDKLVRLPLPQYLAHYFDPRLQTGWYRPIFGMLYLIVYTFFGTDGVAHHMAHIVLHGATAVVLYALVIQVGHAPRAALVAGLVYVGLPVYSKAVYWPSAPDPLSMFLYLLAIFCWIEYLGSNRRRWYVAAFSAFVLTIMTKETSVTLPVVLFLADVWLVGRKTRLPDLIRRYTPYAIVLGIYLLTEYAIQHNGSYVKMANYGVGSYMLTNLINALVLVVLPWDLASPLKYIWLAMASVAFVWITISKRSKVLAFLGIFAVLNLLPVLGFPPEWFEPRYLYISTMATAVVIGCLFETTWTWLGRRQWVGALGGAMVVGILWVNYVGVNQAIADWGEIARQRRVPFREISQQNPTFPPDSYIYFLDSPNVPLDELAGMFLLRYGTDVTVEGINANQVPRLRDHVNSYIYYFDSTGRPFQVPVAPVVQIHLSQPLPVEFQSMIQLESVTIARNEASPQSPIILLLNWRALTEVDRNYTVFVHLVDDKGGVIEGYDAEPRYGRAPTSQWEKNQLIVDAHVLPIDAEVPPGNYRLEIGLYYAPETSRLKIVDVAGQLLSDTLIVEPFKVAE